MESGLRRVRPTRGELKLCLSGCRTGIWEKERIQVKTTLVFWEWLYSLKHRTIQYKGVGHSKRPSVCLRTVTEPDMGTDGVTVVVVKTIRNQDFLGLRPSPPYHLMTQEIPSPSTLHNTGEESPGE